MMACIVVEPSKANTIGTTTACPEYGGIRNLGTSSICLVGIANNQLQLALSDISITCRDIPIIESYTHR